jgi:phosphoglucomutase
MALRPEQSVMERVDILEDALAEVLDRYPIAIDTDPDGDRHLLVPEGPMADSRVRISLYGLARDLERKLA